MPIPAQQAHQQRPQSEPDPPGADGATGYLMVPSVSLRLLFPIMVVVSIFFFVRGHNLPGGGFVAGLIMAVAIILQYMVGGTVWVEDHLKLRPHRWIGLGLLVAVCTGMGSWLAGYPFLTSHSAHPRLPLLGEVPLPSAFMFDLGVYVLVVGATALILIALAHQSLRSQRLSRAQSAAPVEVSGAAPWN